MLFFCCSQCFSVLFLWILFCASAAALFAMRLRVNGFIAALAANGFNSPPYSFLVLVAGGIRVVLKQSVRALVHEGPLENSFWSTTVSPSLSAALIAVWTASWFACLALLRLACAVLRSRSSALRCSSLSANPLPRTGFIAARCPRGEFFGLGGTSVRASHFGGPRPLKTVRGTGARTADHSGRCSSSATWAPSKAQF